MAYMVRRWINGLMFAGQARFRARVLAGFYLSSRGATHVQQLQSYSLQSMAIAHQVWIEAQDMVSKEVL